MCGIFGHIGNIHKDTALHCLNTLSHRGPDGYGLTEHEISPGIKAVLGQRRLAILDLSNKGAQPMTYKDRYTITFNGEIYNFVEIKVELEKQGYVFESESDTEVILASYAQWGPDCLHKFNGMWAIAIWDAQEKTLFLSRDRFGKKPLFYSDQTFANQTPGFTFASEMKAITPILQKTTADIELVTNTKKIFY